MTTRVFLGPTLPVAEAEKALPAAEFFPPVSVGDVLRAVRAGCRTIVLVDGYFQGVPSVWHKEIMYALSQGVTVIGCSSMGALRAAELCRYGMQGYGRIFSSYNDGSYEDDDEVAVIHGDAESGYRPLSEPMVNIRYGLDLARRAGVISGELEELLVRQAKQVFYADRHWSRVIADAGPGETADRLRRFLRETDTNLKRADAIETLWRIANGELHACAPAADFTFEETYSFLVLQESEGYC
ncbi:TfuA-like protein [Streptomyces sp. NPDC057257]|uniref:TfuA-like protein n=1 Tax=Streptomyces sp. NPDC057257 TaxID=3346071 RepID=UPI00363F3E9B